MKQLILFVVVVSVGAVLAGCSDPGEKDAIKTAPMPASAMADRINAIKNDPHMPEDQKAAALARLNSHPVPDKPATGK